jgi:antitoxin (DNA-binding transcriptional repressor) of toxin-antitoxin stability system
MRPSRIIERVERGEEIIIDRAGTPVAKIIPLVRRVNRTAVGSLAGQIDLSRTFGRSLSGRASFPDSATRRTSSAIRAKAVRYGRGDL